MTEQTFFFGSRSHLPGTLTLPRGGPTRHVAMLLLPSGLIHRSGPHRINVKLARRLSEHGFASLRFDLSSIGDAMPSGSARPYAEQAVDEIRAAMDTVTGRTCIDRFLLYGICTGAVHAFAATRADDRVASLYMQDGYAWPTLRTRIRRWLLPIVGEPGRVSRALVRRLRAIPALPGALAARAGQGPQHDGRVDANVDTPLGPGGRTPAQFAALVDALAQRGTSVRLLYTGSLLNLYNYPSQFADSVPIRSAPGLVTCEFLPDVDHTLSNLHAQRVLTASILRWALDEDSRDGRRRYGDLRVAPEGLTA
jgi:hypothetical protein